jgi:hypothetical protein
VLGEIIERQLYKEREDIRGLQSRDSPPEVFPNGYLLFPEKILLSKWSSKDETADDEEEANSTVSVP